MHLYVHRIIANKYMLRIRARTYRLLRTASLIQLIERHVPFFPGTVRGKNELNETNNWVEKTLKLNYDEKNWNERIRFKWNFLFDGRAKEKPNNNELCSWNNALDVRGINKWSRILCCMLCVLFASALGLWSGVVFTTAARSLGVAQFLWGLFIKTFTR